jgi:cyclopropane-fatty-acyl-phospholipid synthase
MRKILSKLKRFILLIIETIVYGPSYARFLYLTRSSEPLNPQETWNYFTKPKGRLFEWLMNNYPPPLIRRLFRDLYYRNSFKFKDHTAGISEHYDLSNSFYQLFLDKKYMFYSAADFLISTETIEIAQENKADYIINLIAPKLGEKILDIGCGWGAMLKNIYDKIGNKENLFGYTLSTEQKKLIDEKYEFQVELKDFITTEYKQKFFDKIFSIGSIEHVRECELLPLYQKLSNALKPNGKIVHQFFCQTEDILPTRLLAVALLIFPGSELTSIKKHLDTFEKANLKVSHHSVHDYRPTLKAWFDRLIANQETAIQLVGVQNYNKYQCYLAEAWRLFDNRDLTLMRFVLEKQDDYTKGIENLSRTECFSIQP